ncbi:hypothetical protein PTI98_010065 [Pleurotus ostreatus]|nr:hypothetical protein PTI98_010065 [Pleurotus ostreatus]
MVAAQDGSEKSSGIISGVFNFVTREIGSFVTAAAGGSTSSIHHNESSTTQRSRSKLQRKQRAHDEPYNVRRRKEKPRLNKTSGECRPQGNTASRRLQEPISPERMDHRIDPMHSTDDNLQRVNYLLFSFALSNPRATYQNA